MCIALVRYGRLANTLIIFQLILLSAVDSTQYAALHAKYYQWKLYLRVYIANYCEARNHETIFRKLSLLFFVSHPVHAVAYLMYQVERQMNLIKFTQLRASVNIRYTQGDESIM